MNRLKFFRNKYHQTQSQVAKDVGVSISSYSKLEQGIRGASDKLKIKIANHFNTTVGVIFFDDPITETNTKFPANVS